MPVAGRYETFEETLEKRALNGTVSEKLLLAAYKGDLALAKELIAQGALINPKEGVTPLFCAAYNGQFKMVKFLWESGANIHQVVNECNALIIAIDTKQMDVIHFLLKKGANVNQICGIINRTALDSAFFHIRWDSEFALNVLKLLITHGADLNINGTSIEKRLEHEKFFMNRDGSFRIIPISKENSRIIEKLETLVFSKKPSTSLNLDGPLHLILRIRGGHGFFEKTKPSEEENIKNEETICSSKS